MPNKRVRVKFKPSRRRVRRNVASFNPPSGVVTYTGPFNVPRTKLSQDMYVIPLYLNITVSSSGAGVITTLVNNNPSGMNGWSSYKGLFNEVRVLSMMAKYENNYNNTFTNSLFQNSLAIVYDHADYVTILAGYTLAQSYSSCKISNTSKPWSYGTKMTGTEEAGFMNTSTGTFATFAIKLYANALTDTTNYGILWITFLCQFKGLL